MEVFAPETDTFLDYQVQVPQESPCVLFVESNLLVLHKSDYVVKYAAGANGQLVEQSRVQSPKVRNYQNSQPVVDGARGVFYMVSWGECLSYNLSSGVKGPSVR
jgi:hypothetical protein